MSVLSKLFGSMGFRMVTYNCYEIGHTWNDSCSGAVLDIAKASFATSLKTYSFLYILSTLARWKNLRNVDLKRLIHDILRSSVFLSTNAYLFIFFLCQVRKTFGFWIFPMVGYTNGILASFFAILLEQKRRRGMLALYLTNLASELVFRMGVHRGYWNKIPKGEVLIFSCALAAYFALLRKDSLDDSIAGILRMIFGIKPGDDVINLQSLPSWLSPYLAKVRAGPSHRLCAHKYSCFSDALEAFLRNFSVAFAINGGLRLFGSIGKLISRPSSLPSVLFSARNFTLPLMVGSLPALFKLTRCLLRWHFNVDNALTHAISGFVAGLSMISYSSTSVSMYVLWKLIEILYFKGVDRGYLPIHKYGDIVLYTLSTGFVLYAGCTEPHCLRKEYWKFLMDLTGGVFGKVNRNLIDAFGSDSSFAFPNFKPELNPLKTTMNPAFLAR